MVEDILGQAFEECGTQLQRIIDAYKRKAPFHPETIVEYANGSISSFNIEGELGENSIPDSNNVTKIDIGNTVTDIMPYAFANNFGNLSSVILPNSISGDLDGVFSYCYNLAELKLGNGISSIADYAFHDCSMLTSITIPNSVKIIGNSSFPTELLNADLGSSIERIGNYSFDGNYHLSSVVFHSHISFIGESSFRDCYEVTITFLNKTVAEVQAMDNYSWEIPNGYGCTIHCTDGDIVL